MTPVMIVSEGKINPMNHHTLIRLWFVTSLISGIAVAAVKLDPLVTVIQGGLSNAYSIKTQLIREQQADLKSTSSKFAFLPTVNLSASRSMSQAESLATGEKASATSHSSALGVSASWNLWDNYQTIRDYQSAQQALDIEHISTDREKERYALAVIETYFDLQLLLDRKEILNGQLEQAKWTKGESDALVQVGSKTRLDAMDTEIEVANAERDIFELSTQITSAERNIKLLLNTDSLVNLPRINMLEYNPFFMSGFSDKLAKSKVPDDKLTYSNLDLLVSTKQLDKSLNEFSQTKLNLWPKTSLRLAHDINLDRYTQDSPPDGIRNYFQSTTLSFEFTWIMWDWFTQSRSTESSRLDLDNSRLQLKQSVEKARADLGSLIEQYEINEKSIESSKLIVEKANKQLSYSREMYKLGRINILNLQQSNSRLFDSKVALANRLRTRFSTAARVLNTLGVSIIPNTKTQ